ncbi:hypothetical protein S245_036637 [Arachis hypogaea]
MECGSQLQITGDVASDTYNVTNCNEMIASSCASSVGCCSEGDVTESENSLNSILVQMEMNCSVTKVLREDILQKFNARVPGECLLPGNKNPDWLTFSGEGSFVNFDVPHVNGYKLKTMMLCVSYSSSPNIKVSEGHIIKNLFIINLTKTTHYLYDGDTLASLREEEWHKVISNLEAKDEVQIVVVARVGIIMKKITVYLIYGEPIDIVCGDDMVADRNVTVHGGDEKKNLKPLGKRKLQRV